MPPNNQFRHQVYTAQCPTAPYDLLRPKLPPAVGSIEFHDQIRQAGRQIRDGGVSMVYLVHGSFTGSDALGIVREVERVAPSLGHYLRRQQKQIIDAVAGDSGNYSQEYADLLCRGINDGYSDTIPIRLVDWSSENLHGGRADGAVQLLDDILTNAPVPGRILLLGHSHAGNVFALVTNLLGGDKRSRNVFFSAARAFYRWPGTRSVHKPAWSRLQERFQQEEYPFDQLKLDFATFGTPIRNGWDTNGYSNLLHFVHHRPLPWLAEYLFEFPPPLDDIARQGDCFHQLGIAGTNFLPYVFAWRGWVTEFRLGRLLQSGIRRRDLWDRLQLGQRVPDEGRTLLVDYPDDERHLRRLHLGHAIYTRHEWLPFHALQIATRFYG